jgi:hypothetical protein
MAISYQLIRFEKLTRASISYLRGRSERQEREAGAETLLAEWGEGVGTTTVAT